MATKRKESLIYDHYTGPFHQRSTGGPFKPWINRQSDHKHKLQLLTARHVKATPSTNYIIAGNAQGTSDNDKSIQLCTQFASKPASPVLLMGRINNQGICMVISANELFSMMINSGLSSWEYPRGIERLRPSSCCAGGHASPLHLTWLALSPSPTMLKTIMERRILSLGISCAHQPCMLALLSCVTIPTESQLVTATGSWLSPSHAVFRPVGPFLCLSACLPATGHSVIAIRAEMSSDGQKVANLLGHATAFRALHCAITRVFLQGCFHIIGQQLSVYAPFSWF